MLSFSYDEIYWDLKDKRNIGILTSNAFVLPLFSLQILGFFEASISAESFMRCVGSQPSGNFLIDTQETNRKINEALLMFKKC